MRRRTFLLAVSMAAVSAGVAQAQFRLPSLRRSDAPAPPVEDARFIDIPYATWSNQEPPYLLFPGDEIELILPTYPEGNRVLAVRPDGRITLPLIGEAMMAAGRSLEEVQAEASFRLSRELRRPIVEMNPRPAPLYVYVDGEVGTPSRIDLVGDANALQAVAQAGGAKSTADLRRVIIVRRAPDGQNLMMRTANLEQARRHGQQPDLVPLARGDVVIVPRTGLARAGNLVQQVLAALPVTFSYAINGYGG